MSNRNKYYKVGNLRLQFFFRLESFWMGVHYSKQFNAYCIAPLPCCVMRVTFKENNP